MKSADIIRHRLINQQIADPVLKDPSEVVRWMVAMQAQEFAHAKWAIALRSAGALHDTDIESAFNVGSILRTHLMRPTWHFVGPQDIRWLLALTAPRVHAINKYWYTKFNLTTKLFDRSQVIFEKSLRDHHYLTRAELNAKLAQQKIVADGLQLGYLMMHAELEGIICSGPRKGKQFTYALLDERVPRTKKVGREESLLELSRRYIASRGPASADDFANWSGLTSKDSRMAMDAIKDQFEQADINGKQYLFPAQSLTWKKSYCATFMMPDYDEYGMSYKDRQAIALTERRIIPEDRLEYQHWIVIDGRIGGAWKQIKRTNATEVSPTFFASLSIAKEKEVARAVARFISFSEKSKPPQQPKK